MLEVMARLSNYDHEKHRIICKKENDGMYRILTVDELSNFTQGFLSRHDARIVPKEWAGFICDNNKNSSYEFLIRGPVTIGQNTDQSLDTHTQQKIVWDQCECTEDGNTVTFLTVGRDGQNFKLQMAAGEFTDGNVGLWKKVEKRIAKVEVSYFVEIPGDKDPEWVYGSIEGLEISVDGESSHDHDVEGVEIRDAGRW